MSKKNSGKDFEQQFTDSCTSVGIFFDRIKDQFIPNDIRVLLQKYNKHLPTSKNKFDFYIYSKPMLLALEFKSINAKSISITDPKIIKPHQITELEKASKYEGIVAGFIFNFRGTEENETYFVHIDEFIKYRNIAINGLEHTYRSKVNKSSIPVGICSEVGIRINNKIKKVNYQYDVEKFLEDIKKIEEVQTSKIF